MSVGRRKRDDDPVRPGKKRQHHLKEERVLERGKEESEYRRERER